MKRYAAIIGEAIIDLVAERGEDSFRSLPGGSPLNVAVGVSRLGEQVEFITSFGSDVFARQLVEALAREGVSVRHSVGRPALTSLAVTTFAGAEPSFAFYGSPPSYGQIGLEDTDFEVISKARLVHAGSIALLEASTFRLADAVFDLPDPVKTVDPNVRPSLIDDVDRYRSNIESLLARADVVKLSQEDALHLFQLDAEEALAYVTGLGALVAVVTMGRQGALAAMMGRVVHVPSPAVQAVDATGAGDAFMAALIARILGGGLWTPDELDAVVEFAVRVAASACCARGGASSMPTPSDVETRLRMSRLVSDA